MSEVDGKFAHVMAGRRGSITPASYRYAERTATSLSFGRTRSDLSGHAQRPSRSDFRSNGLPFTLCCCGASVLLGKVADEPDEDRGQVSPRGPAVDGF